MVECPTRRCSRSALGFGPSVDQEASEGYSRRIHRFIDHAHVYSERTHTPQPRQAAAESNVARGPRPRRTALRSQSRAAPHTARHTHHVHETTKYERIGKTVQYSGITALASAATHTPDQRSRALSRAQRPLTVHRRYTAGAVRASRHAPALLARRARSPDEGSLEGDAAAAVQCGRAWMPHETRPGSSKVALSRRC